MKQFHEFFSGKKSSSSSNPPVGQELVPGLHFLEPLVILDSEYHQKALDAMSTCQEWRKLSSIEQNTEMKKIQALTKNGIGTDLLAKLEQDVDKYHGNVDQFAKLFVSLLRTKTDIESFKEISARPDHYSDRGNHMLFNVAICAAGDALLKNISSHIVTIPASLGKLLAPEFCAKALSEMPEAWRSQSPAEKTAALLSIQKTVINFPNEQYHLNNEFSKHISAYGEQNAQAIANLFLSLCTEEAQVSVLENSSLYGYCHSSIFLAARALSNQLYTETSESTAHVLDTPTSKTSHTTIMHSTGKIRKGSRAAAAAALAVSA